MAKATEGLSSVGSRIELLPDIKEDIDGIVEHLLAHGSEDVAARVNEILEGLELLSRHPNIGRPAGFGNQRELVLGRGSRGYVALYEYIAEVDTVFVVAIRSQREAGYAR